MKGWLLLATFFPGVAFAFHPVPIPRCPKISINSSQADIGQALGCQVNQAVSTAWNESRGDLKGTLDYCRYAVQRLMPDNKEGATFACFYSIAVQGLIPGIGRVPLNGPHHDLDFLAITNSKLEISAHNVHAAKLRVTFENSSDYTQAWPNLKIVLKDEAGSTTGSVVVTAKEYLENSVLPTQGLPAQSERTVRFDLDVVGKALTASQPYDLKIFY